MTMMTSSHLPQSSPDFFLLNYLGGLEHILYTQLIKSRNAREDESQNHTEPPRPLSDFDELSEIEGREVIQMLIGIHLNYQRELRHDAQQELRTESFSQVGKF
jgi:hypothetical protein